MVLVIHGTLRNAEEYRDHTKPFADRLGCDLAAPRFDRERFPSSKFQQGGLFDESGRVQAKKEWTWTSIPELAQELNERAGTPNRRYVLLGHSAGGQLVGRMAAFLDAPGSTYIAANPSSWVFPHRDWDYPYGFGGLPEDLGGDAAIERYLARPLVIYLGTGDTERDEYLDKSAEADRQGQSRLARGRAFFDAGSRLATERGWAFGWRKVEAEGVAHDHEVMFNHLALDRILVATPTKSGG
jgi:hypothetical protein